MKKLKFFIILIIFFCIALSGFADVMPYYTSSLSKQTIGFLQVPQTFSLYMYPRFDSEIVDTVKWTNTSVTLKKSSMEPSALFAAQIHSKNLAFCFVVDEQDDWYKIIYDKTNNKSAWIHPNSEDSFWGLREFYSYFGRKYGLYYMKNVDYRKRGIYSAADPASQKLGGFTLIKAIRLNKLSGNWALVTVSDFDSMPKIGYIQWRESDGTILIFPKLDK